ncbi:flagellar motor switch protein FliM [Clostridium fallax]|uniref:Flagellar motor switch protein FliM n=1 Tax=Clostridium fallax TaxID=1533 RepID=A0A1M4UME7_9CLOT|nr:flagellar motor switch protein FliM [Clostridium fallax]SHE57854.1 flagellar motor switch protein FliM [Clostridium fallax]SQB07643.1 flagellar motor switch protein FliM [Clostridium fallax]
MADVLSQSEIDALLSALSTGELEPEELDKEEEKQKIKPYDFRSPQKFSKEHIRTLERIHDNFSRIISNYLTAQVRKNTKVKIESVEQITYEEFIHSIPTPTILFQFKMSPLNGSILFEMNPSLAYQIIDILLGGTGNKGEVNKEFTEIDKNILSQMGAGMLSNLKLAWEDVADVSIEMEGLETNPALNQTLAPNEPVALITFSVEIGSNNTFMHLCIPYLSIEKILEKLVIQYWFQSDDNENIEESQELIKEKLNSVDINISAELGKTVISVDDFLQLVVGDVIKLDNKCSSPVKVIIEDEESYYGKPGIIGKNRGVAILDIIDKDVDKYE